MILLFSLLLIVDISYFIAFSPLFFFTPCFDIVFFRATPLRFSAVTTVSHYFLACDYFFRAFYADACLYFR